MTEKCTFIVFAVLLVASGCAMDANIHKPYSPSLTINGSGNISVDDFTYAPTSRAVNPLASNQIETFHGPTSIYTDVAISEVVKNAFIKELKLAGYRMDRSADIQIEGSVLEFSYDYIGLFYANFGASINFRVFKIEDGKRNLVYSKTHNSKIKIDKRLGSEYIYVSLSKAIESFIVDAKGLSLIE